MVPGSASSLLAGPVGRDDGLAGASGVTCAGPGRVSRRSSRQV